MNKLSPSLKGLITAIIMIGADLLVFRYQGRVDFGILYIDHFLLLAGCLWTLYPYRKRFGELFSIGFRSFIMVVILMVAFKYIIVKTHPELAANEKAQVILELKKQGNNTPEEIETISEKAKKQFPIIVVSLSIFGYLIIGAAYTALTAGILSRRK